MRRIGGLIIVVMMISSLVLAGCSSQPSENTQSTQSNQPTSAITTQSAVKISSDLDFRLNDINGQPVLLSSFSGKVILLNFWATWCGPCTGEMPHFQELSTEWSTRNDIVFLAVDIGEGAGTVKSFMQENNYTFTVLLDSQGKVADKYGVRYTPTSILIGQDGKIKFRIVGAFKDKAAILKAIDDSLPQ